MSRWDASWRPFALPLSATTRTRAPKPTPIFDYVTLTSGICSHVLDGTPLLAKKVKGDKRVDGKKRRASEGKWIALIVVVVLVLGGYRRTWDCPVHPLREAFFSA